MRFTVSFPRFSSAFPGFHSSSSPADSDDNVILELNKEEIDDAHKDKQKMFSDNFRVRLPRACFPSSPTDTPPSFPGPHDLPAHPADYESHQPAQQQRHTPPQQRDQQQCFEQQLQHGRVDAIAELRRIDPEKRFRESLSAL
jgi:hypothetical protein